MGRNGILVYFAAAIRGDRVVAEDVRMMIQFIQEKGISVLSEHVGAADPVAMFAHRVGKRKDEVTKIDIERQDIAWLDEATHVIAEISGASTGTGREIEHGRVKGELGKTPAKVLCLYRQDREFSASAMIRGMTPDRYPNVMVLSYANLDDALSHILSFLQLQVELPL